MRTSGPSRPVSSDVLRFDKRIRVMQGIWRYALSDDGRYVAYAEAPTMKIFVVDIEAGTTTEMQAPQLNAKSAIAWHPDGEHFAVLAARQCLIISAKEGRCVREIANPEPARFGEAALFSRDGSKLFVERSAGNQDTVVIELDLATLQAGGFSMPDKGAEVQHARAGSGCFRRCQDDRYSTVTAYSTGAKSPLGLNIFHDFGLCLNLSEGSSKPTTFRLDPDAADDDSSGHNFDFKSQFLYSQPTDSYVFYRPPYNMAIDTATYVPLHTFKADGTQLLSFADFDVLRQRCRKGIEVHPRHPWVITTISVPEPDPSGEIIIWDFRTGEIVQRLTSGLAASRPIISADGRTMVVTDPHVAVFRFG